MAHSDVGSVLPPDSAAFSVSAEGQYQMYLPQGWDEAEQVPEGMLLVVAVATRALDHEWVAEMLAWLDREMRN